jgi:hypothetical protein
VNVQQLIDNLQEAIAQGTVDPKAEIMISAPMFCSQNPADIGRQDHLTIPVLSLEVGSFSSSGHPWVIVQGTSVWGEDLGFRTNDEVVHRVLVDVKEDLWNDDETTPVFHLVEDHELEEVK